MEYQSGMVAKYMSLKLRRMRQEDCFELGAAWATQ